MDRPWARIVAGVLAVVFAADAVTQLVAPLWWYGAVPGVVATGPFNPHFVRDIGAAFLVTAGGLGWYAWRPREGTPALVAAAGFLTLHAAIHVFDATCGPHPLKDVMRDLAGVYLPALLALGLALQSRPKGDPHAESHPGPSDRQVRARLGL